MVDKILASVPADYRELQTQLASLVERVGVLEQDNALMFAYIEHDQAFHKGELNGDRHIPFQQFAAIYKRERQWGL